MEPVFENRTILTKKMIEELVIAPIPWIVPLRIVFTVLLGVFYVALIVMAVYRADVENAVLQLGNCTVCLIFSWTIPSISANTVLNKIQKANGNGKTESVVWFGDWIETNHESGGIVKFDYSQIRRVYALKSSYAIKIGNQAIILDRDGFTKGTFKEFKQFLKEKCPDLKVVD